MKRLCLIMAIFISCLAVMTGCSDDGTRKRFLPLLEIDADTTDSATDPDNATDPNANITVFKGPSAVEATDGDYKDKVGVNWATVDKAVKYNIYRSGKIEGPFTEKVAAVDAADLKNADSSVVTTETTVTPDTTGTDPGTVSTTAGAGTCDKPVMQASYQSKRNIGNGIWLPWGVHPLGEHYSIEVWINGVSRGVATFDGSSSALGTTWTQSRIAAKFNEILGSYGTCSPVTDSSGNKVIRIVSQYQIRLTNYYELVQALWVPLDFLDTDSHWSTELVANPVQIACNDTIPPTVKAVSPANGATDIALNTKVSVAFSEAFNPATMTTASFRLSEGGNSVAGEVSNTGVFTPAAELKAGTEYTATVTTAVTDLAGNHLAADYTWKFTTHVAGSGSSGSPGTSVLYYYTDTDVSSGAHYYYAVTAVDSDGKESEKSPVEEGFTKANDNVPAKVASCTASDGLAGGVTVTWPVTTGATYYRVYRTSASGMTQVGGDITGTTYTDTSVEPGLFSYKVAPFNSYGEGGNSSLDPGFRGVTDQEFFDLVYAEEESGLGRITKLQKTGQDMLGDETVFDLNGDGKCVYKATYDLFSDKATILITMSDFCDYYLILDGTLTTLANSSGTGTITGQLDVTGIYSGYVKFNLSITDGTATGGTYTVKQSNGSSETTIPYSYVPN